MDTVAPVPEAETADAPATSPPKKKAELLAVAPMVVPEKPSDAPAIASAKKKLFSSKDKKRKGKSSSDPATSVEAPVTKKAKKVNLAPRSSGAAATTAAGLATARLVQDADAIRQTLQQPTISAVLSESQSHEAGCLLAGTKRKRQVVNQQKPRATKQFKPPMARKSPPMARKLNSPAVMGSPMMRLLVSPLVLRPRSPALGPRRSPSRSLGRSPSHSLGRSPARSPGRSLSRSPGRSPAHSPRSGAASHDHG